jgi:Rieske Fe-S protein
MRDDGVVRKLLLPLFVGVGILGALAVLAFIAQRSPAAAPPPAYAVAKVSSVSMTPLAFSVVTPRGADRLRQRERTQFATCPGGIGCPVTTQLRPTLVFLIRDDTGQLHAFIGEDPRNGCALEWMTIPVSPPNRDLNDAVFHDVCHGSLYDRRGHVAGGPSPFDLNELATEIRGGDVYIDPSRILIGQCPGCTRRDGATPDPARTAVPVAPR